MRRPLLCVVRTVAVLALVLGAAAPAGAAPLNPNDFASLGAFPTGSGMFFIDTRALTITGPGITMPLQGVLSTSGVAVFNFNSINLNANQDFVVGPPPPNSPATPPLALLSRGDITINGMLDVSAPPPSSFPSGPPNAGGPGGYKSDSGPGAGVFGMGSLSGLGLSTTGGGGGFGGSGGNGGATNNPPLTVIPFGGGAGGSSYGNLAVSLQGGSGGGTLNSHAGSFSGGGGGGALELGAVGAISISGSILANGGFGSGSGAGGGGGGGIFLHGDSVTLLSTSVLSATGGTGGVTYGGGGGGGGQVLIEFGPDGFTGNVANINVSGGAGTSTPSFFPPGPFSAAGAPGIITITAIPEPASLVLLGLGLIGVLGFARQAGRRAAA
jgi:hypothetical protein